MDRKYRTVCCCTVVGVATAIASIALIPHNPKGTIIDKIRGEVEIAHKYHVGFGVSIPEYIDLANAREHLKDMTSGTRHLTDKEIDWYVEGITSPETPVMTRFKMTSFAGKMLSQGRGSYIDENQAGEIEDGLLKVLCNDDDKMIRSTVAKVVQDLGLENDPRFKNCWEGVKNNPWKPGE
jgi:hypothetical protein